MQPSPHSTKTTVAPQCTMLDGTGVRVCAFTKTCGAQGLMEDAQVGVYVRTARQGLAERTVAAM